MQYRFDNITNEWDADYVELNLYSTDELIGTANFDLTRFIDAGASTEKISMVADDEAESDTIVMKGNHQIHPDAYIKVRIYADTVKVDKKETPSKENTDTPNQGSYVSMMSWAFSSP